MIRFPWQRPGAAYACAYRCLYLLLGVIAVFGFNASPRVYADSSPSPRALLKKAAVPLPPSYGKLPISFELNLGQKDPRAEFIARGVRSSIFLTSTGAILRIAPPSPGTQESKRTPPSVVRMTLLGAHTAKLSGCEPQPGRINYLYGNDPRRWHRNVPTFSRVKYSQVYPGVDLLYYGNQQQLEYDLSLAPGADPRQIRLGFSGMRALKVDSRGDLLIQTPAGDARFLKPVIYQTILGRKKRIPGRYQLKKGREVGFIVASYDRRLPLVIDPVLVYSTYLGSQIESGDTGYGIAVDTQGNAYITGETHDAIFPTQDALQPDYGGGGTTDVFVTKLNAGGNGLVYSTYIGGVGNDTGSAIAVNAAGNAYVAGYTDSATFPIKNSIQPKGKYQDGFVLKLNPDGNGLVYSTLLDSGDGLTYIYSMSMDASGSVYVTGETNGTAFPTTSSAYQVKSAHSGSQTFISRLNPEGNALLYSTYLEGDGNFVSAHAIAADDLGNAYVTGYTLAYKFPTTPNAYKAEYGSDCCGELGFLVKIDTNAAGAASLAYSSYLPGGEGQDIALDSAGKVYITGFTDTSKFPATPNAYQKTSGGGTDAFLMKLDLTKSGSEQLLYSTYLGGSDNEDVTFPGGLVSYPRGFGGIVIDSAGNVIISGDTRSTNFPLVNAFQPVRGDTSQSGSAQHEGFLAKFNTTAATGPESLLYSTYLGGKSNDSINAIALDSNDSLYLTGYTYSSNFPLAFPYQDTLHNGEQKIFIAKLTESSATQLFAASPPRGGNAGAVTVTLNGLALPDGVSVKLAGAGSPDIAGNPSRVLEGRQITSTFDLTGAPPGLRDLVVTLPDNKTLTLSKGFRVENGGFAQVWVDVTGRSVIRAQRDWPYTFYFGNRGTIDARGTPIIRLPKDASWKITFPPPPMVNGNPVAWETFLHPLVQDDELILFLPSVQISPSRPFVVRMVLRIPSDRESFTFTSEWAGP